MQTPNKTRDPQRLAELLKNHTLRTLLHKTQKIAEIDRLWQQMLSEELKSHCHVMNMTQQVLMVAVDSAAWATRVHYLSASLLNELQKKLPDLSHVTKIRCRIMKNLPLSKSHTASHPAYPISNDSAALIHTTAQTVQHPALKAALLRLSKTKTHEKK